MAETVSTYNLLTSTVIFEIYTSIAYKTGENRSHWGTGHALAEGQTNTLSHVNLSELFTEHKPLLTFQHPHAVLTSHFIVYVSRWFCTNRIQYRA